MKWLLWMWVLLAVGRVAGQGVWQVVGQAAPGFEVLAASVDRSGQLYIGGADGQIACYDLGVARSQYYSPARPGAVSLLEAWQGVRVFAFSRDLQQFVWLNRWLSLTEPLSVPDEWEGFVRLMAPAADEALWVYDEGNFELFKYDLSSGQRLTRLPLDLVFAGQTINLQYLREYQNLLLLADAQTGVYVLDRFANLSGHIPIKGLRWFGCVEDEIYYLEKNTLIFHPLYGASPARREQVPVSEARQVLCAGPRRWVLTANEVILYEIREK